MTVKRRREEKRSVAVRMDKELIPPLRRLIIETKDEFGRRRYRNLARAITVAVEEFLKKHDFPATPEKHRPAHGRTARR